jgi:hypothetical protein
MLEANIHSNTAPIFYHGRTVTSNVTAAVVITPILPKLLKGVRLKANSTNTGTVYVGKTGVTAMTNVALDGWPLLASEEVFIPTDDPTLVFALASVNLDSLTWIAE